MLFDTHVHSRFSPDSEMDPAEAVRVLAEKGYGVCFTEHVDYVTPLAGLDTSATDRPRGNRDFITDLTRYPKEYADIKSESVLTGLEIGLCAAYLPANRKAAALSGLDYVIGSIHFVDGYDLYIDYCQGPFDDPYRRMLEYTCEMIELCDFFDSLGHIDYLSRYSSLPEKEIYYQPYADVYDEVFKALIQRDLAIEINTSRFGNSQSEANLFRIYKRFHELGGRFVTLGSDGHRPEDLGRHFGAAQIMAREAGLTPVYYKERKRRVCNE